MHYDDFFGCMHRRGAAQSRGGRKRRQRLPDGASSGRPCTPVGRVWNNALCKGAHSLPPQQHGSRRKVDRAQSGAGAHGAAAKAAATGSPGASIQYSTDADRCQVLQSYKRKLARRASCGCDEAATGVGLDARQLRILSRQAMRMHLLENLRQRIEAGHDDFVNELRVCTTVFCGLPSLQVPLRLCCPACKALSSFRCARRCSALHANPLA